MPVLDNSVVQVSVEAGLHIGHVFQLRYGPDGYLLLPEADTSFAGHSPSSILRLCSSREKYSQGKAKGCSWAGSSLLL